VDTSPAADRKNLRRALAAGATEAQVEAAFREAYGRGTWNPRIQDVARVLTGANEKRNGAPRPVPASPPTEFQGGPRDLGALP
jgi:hypothetical protein